MLWDDQIEGEGVSVSFGNTNYYILVLQWHSLFNTNSQIKSIVKDSNWLVEICTVELCENALTATIQIFKFECIDQLKFEQVKYKNNALDALQYALSSAKLSPREEPIFVGIHCR